MSLRYFLKLFILFSLFMTAVSEGMYGTEVRYARGFSVREYDDFTLVSVHPSGPDGGEGKGGEVLRYALVQKEGLADPRFREKISASLKAVGGADLVPVPLESLVSLSTTFLPPLVFFDKKEVLKGVDSLKNIYDEDLRRDLETGGVVEVGNGPGLDIEKLLALQPEAVMTNLVEGEWNVVPGLRRAGIPVLVNSDYLETSPLGRAEWVKFVALFIDAEQEAELFFREIEERYLSLREMVKDLDRPSEEKPEVFFNNPQSGRWVVPGGGGYMAAFVRDAGASYIWEDERGSASLVLDEEAVFARVLRAEVWLHQYGWRSLGEALRQKPAFARLEAVRGGRVVNNDARVNLSGSNDFYESGPYWPDRILADLISIFYPDLLPDHKLYYYRFLERE